MLYRRRVKSLSRDKHHYIVWRRVEGVAIGFLAELGHMIPGLTRVIFKLCVALGIVILVFFR